jgi:NO-binding membrane sensor protein with MHYT domain
MLLAIVVVGVGLFIVGYGNGGWPRLLVAGVLVGVGVAGMHYLGMAAMSMPDTMSYGPLLFVVSVVIAVAAGTAALWIGTWVRSWTATIGASLVFGVAVSGMHYTGMAAMHVYAAPAMSMAGSPASSFLSPLIIGISVLSLILTLTISLAPSEEEIRLDAQLTRTMEELQARQAQQAREAANWRGPQTR